MDVTLNSTLSWAPIAGAEFQVQVLDAVSAPVVAPIDTGTKNSVGTRAVLAGLPGGAYRIQVRALLPGGGLPSPWASVEVALVGPLPSTGLGRAKPTGLAGFALPTGLVIA